MRSRLPRVSASSSARSPITPRRSARNAPPCETAVGRIDGREHRRIRFGPAAVGGTVNPRDRIATAATQPLDARSAPRTLSELIALLSAITAVAFLVARLVAQTPSQGGPDWQTLEPEMMQQFQAVLRFDTRDPPSNEHPVADYVKGVFDKAGIPAQIFALDPNR